ncbi:probable jasmonic acid carboxyl methyltransferase 2 isoform X2 [Magnolia sinica]|uniref:probable jasmonic acid carboxyl methyltransferase 2 isoform X2 n=1 Tax=Magnolia sinica TaxID=86752 RepID=UPI002657F4FC|nr:probable jasmonic acid carboxyl methyltransferase 2 isoform X2 [Magnolia sinica]
MEVQQVLHMTAGAGDTSYVNNSSLQRTAIDKAKPIVINAILDLFKAASPEMLSIADLGCSSGPNTLLVISEIINAIDGRCRDIGRSSPEFRVFLNDLYSNDFNTLFRSLPSFHEKLRKERGNGFRPCYLAGVPGSFYGRLFPDSSLHFIHSAASLHWLFQVPPLLESENGITLNKGNVYIGKSSPPLVFKAYLEQFQRDFSLFLSSRSREMVAGGRMVLALLGRRSHDPYSGECGVHWGLLAQSLNDMVSQNENLRRIEDMDVEHVFHMNGGDGEASYAQNSFLPKTAIQKAKHAVEKAIQELYCTFPDSLSIADLGCSSGPNTLLVISEIIDTVDGIRLHLRRPSPEFRVFLNDLPSNDFNNLFRSLPGFYEKLKKEKGDDFGSCYVAGVPGSFYGRLFPYRSLHFVHSSYCLHWLSRVPPLLETENGIALNKGNICMGKSSHPLVFKAYSEQFNGDFSLFLSSRSVEIVEGGKMVITLVGRTSPDPCSEECRYVAELLALALDDMVSEGMVEEAKVDSFNVPYYPPSIGEVKAAIEREGSFDLGELEIFKVSWDPSMDDDNGNFVCDKYASGMKVAKFLRSVLEPMLVSHFGKAIIDDLFQRYGKKVADHMSKENPKHVNLVVSMTKRG